MVSDEIRGLADYVNIPRTIATVISANRATLHELDTVYGLEDLWALLEIITIDNYNAEVARRRSEQ
ncbi:hypothetical protein [Dickeya poaceiphila]|uniref:Transglycosylase n=1 Tax=Dickeya poaceiphila TaxID=568768 RepID=A0A5B8HJS5_9GAMM|nr:hypothetical protein [Dickeya poaceiphila]QDX29556.1 transglycosylase [Dickeya poaceiphila]